MKQILLRFNQNSWTRSREYISSQSNITVTVEQIAISVTFPDLGDTDDILLGVVQAASSKGCDQVDMILNLLQYYDIGEPNLCCSCVPTASNTGCGLWSHCVTFWYPQHSPPMVPQQETHDWGIYLPCHGGTYRRKDKGSRRGLTVNLQKV